MTDVAAIPQTPRRESLLSACARGVAGLIGVSLLINAFGGLLWPTFDATVWLLNLRTLPRSIGAAIGIVAGAVLIAWAVHTRSSRAFRIANAMACFSLLCFAIADSAGYYRLLLNGGLHSGAWLAWSVIVAAALLVVIVATFRQRQEHASPRRFISLASACLACGGFLLAQMTLFGMTDYRRPADAILVFGARVYADGRPSLAVADRVRTGVELYKQGFAPRLILSGGPGDGEIHECEGMAAHAESLGVPRSAIVLDCYGLNTESSIQNARRLLNDGDRLLIVSHFYHMARVKLCAERAGLRSYTVPAQQERPLARTPYYMAREAAALVAYYFRRPVT